MFYLLKGTISLYLVTWVIGLKMGVTVLGIVGRLATSADPPSWVSIKVL